jgi:hypothetical protein
MKSFLKPMFLAPGRSRVGPDPGLILGTVNLHYYKSYYSFKCFLKKFIVLFQAKSAGSF